MPTTAAAARLARPPERDDREQRQQEEGVELRGDREAQHERAESRAAGEKRCDRAGRQGDGQRIEARQHELAEEERRGGDEPERERCVADRRAHRPQGDGGEDDRRGQEQCHQRREPARVPAGRVVQLGLVDRSAFRPRDERRDQEGGESARWVLDPEVAVRHLAVRHPIAERLVERHVPGRRVVGPRPLEGRGRGQDGKRAEREEDEVARSRRPPHSGNANAAGGGGTVPPHDRPVDRAPRLPPRSGAARRRRARELRPPGARLAARARPRLVGLLALVPPGRGRRPAVLRAAGLPHARGAARHGNPDVARRRGAHGGRLRGSLRALAPRLGVGGGSDLTLRRARHGRRPPPRRAVRRAVPRGVERPGLRVRARVVGRSGRARLAHRLDHVALGGGRRRRAPHPDPARRADRAARLRARPAPRAAPLDACASRRRDVPRGRGAAPRRLGGAQRRALRRPRRGAREQGVGSLLPRRRRRRPGERRRVAPARGRHRGRRS